jgi:hypothetical protein
VLGYPTLRTPNLILKSQETLSAPPIKAKMKRFEATVNASRKCYSWCNYKMVILVSG